LMDGVVELIDGIHIPLQGGSYSLHIYQSCDTTTVLIN
jgi:hypothetical protein